MVVSFGIGVELAVKKGARQSNPAVRRQPCDLTTTTTESVRTSSNELHVAVTSIRTILGYKKKIKLWRLLSFLAKLYRWLSRSHDLAGISNSSNTFGSEVTSI